MSPAVCGVFQPWEPACTVWIRKEKGNEKRDVFSEDQRESMFSYYSNELKNGFLVTVCSWANLIQNLNRVKNDHVTLLRLSEMIDQVVPNGSVGSDKTSPTGILYPLYSFPIDFIERSFSVSVSNHQRNRVVPLYGAVWDRTHCIDTVYIHRHIISISGRHFSVIKTMKSSHIDSFVSTMIMSAAWCFRVKSPHRCTWAHGNTFLIRSQLEIYRKRR